MGTVDISNWQSQLRKGLLDTVILNLLQHGNCFLFSPESTGVNVRVDQNALHRQSSLSILRSELILP